MTDDLLATAIVLAGAGIIVVALILMANATRRRQDQQELRRLRAAINRERTTRYRSMTILARQIDAGDWDACRDIAEWCGGQLVDIEAFMACQDTAVIYLPGMDDEDTSYAQDGDWIVRSATGAFTVCPDDAFHPAVQS